MSALRGDRAQCDAEELDEAGVEGHALRVELEGHHRQGLVLEGLDDAVRRTGRDREAPAHFKRPHAVRTVDDRAVGADDAGDAGAGFEVRKVEVVDVGVCHRHPVADQRILVLVQPLRRQFERAPEERVDDLRAVADAGDRDAASEGDADRAMLKGAALRIVLELADPSGNHQGVGLPEGGLELHVIVREGNHHGDESGLVERVDHVRLRDGLAVCGAIVRNCDKPAARGCRPLLGIDRGEIAAEERKKLNSPALDEERLGVELDAERRIVRSFDRLDDVVRRDGGDLKALGDVLHGLMVAGVDRDHRTDQLVEVGAGLDGGFVLALEAVDLRAFLFGRKVLPERAAEADVEELAAAADSKEGHPASDCLVRNREFPGVSAQVDFAEFRMVRFAVTRRCEILSAAEDEHVHAVQEGGD